MVGRVVPDVEKVDIAVGCGDVDRHGAVEADPTTKSPFCLVVMNYSITPFISIRIRFRVKIT